MGKKGTLKDEQKLKRAVVNARVRPAAKNMGGS